MRVTRRTDEARSSCPEETQPAITSIDLFAGAGGLTAGLHQGSDRIRTLLAVEHDIAAAAAFEANHGEGLVHPGGIEEWLQDGDVPEVDLLVGGPPCQGFSQLNRSKVGVERNSLWKRYADTIRLANPRWFLMENVSTFLKSPEFHQMASWTERGGVLADYSVSARVLLAADFGVPQKRQRTVVIGHRRDVPPPGFPEQTHGSIDYVTVADAFTDMRPTVFNVALPQREVVFSDRTLPGPFRSDELHLTRHYEARSLERFRAIPAGGSRFDLPEHLKTDGWKTHTAGSGDVMGRMHWDRPSVTIRTEFFKPEKGRYLHPTQMRAITHFEAARLQGFPDDYLWVGSKSQIARQIGNAVPPPLGAALGRLIAQAAE